MNSLTSLLEITHKSLFRDHCSLFFLCHCVYFCYALAHRALALSLQCAFCSSHGSWRGIWGEQVSQQYTEHVTTTGHSDSPLQPGLHGNLLLPAQGRQVCHSGHVKPYCQPTAAPLNSLGNQAGSALQHRQLSQPSLPARPREEWNTAKERTRLKGLSLRAKA